MTPDDRTRDMTRTLLVSLLMTIVLTACSGGGVKGESPYMQVTSWNMDGRMLNASLRIRNVNDEDMNVSAITMRVDVQDKMLVNYQGNHSIEIPANGFETVEISAPATLEGTDLLVLLNDGQLKSLPYTLETSVMTQKHGRLENDREGHLYTVPGKPGYFR